MKNKVSQMADQELASELSSVRQSIEEIDCFGVSDLVYEELLVREIEKRHLKIVKHTSYELINNN